MAVGLSLALLADVWGCSGGTAQVTAPEAGPLPVEASVEAAAPDAGPDAPPACACDPSQICVNHQCISKGTIATPPVAACANPPCINVYNNCTIPLWIHPISTVLIDEGNIREVQPGAQYQYAGLTTFGGGRIYAYYQQPTVLQSPTAPVSPFNQFVEMSITQDAQNDNAWVQNYNLSFVDYIALPVSLQAEGCEATRCGSQFADWVRKLQECPTSLRNFAPDVGVGTCMGSYNYCITQDGDASYDQTQPYCSKMQAAHGYPGSAVYGGVFPSETSADVPFWDGVAGWNRGTFGGDPDASDYFVHEPYNDYAKMIHVDMGCRETSTIAGVYAFSTDDHQDQSGFVECDSPVLDVVWCPYQESE